MSAGKTMINESTTFPRSPSSLLFCFLSLRLIPPSLAFYFNSPPSFVFFFCFNLPGCWPSPAPPVSPPRSTSSPSPSLLSPSSVHHFHLHPTSVSSLPPPSLTLSQRKSAPSIIRLRRVATESQRNLEMNRGKRRQGVKYEVKGFNDHSERQVHSN